MNNYSIQKFYSIMRDKLNAVLADTTRSETDKVRDIRDIINEYTHTVDNIPKPKIFPYSDLAAEHFGEYVTDNVIRPAIMSFDQEPPVMPFESLI